MEAILFAILFVCVFTPVIIVQTSKTRKLKATEELMKKCKLEGTTLYINEQSELFSNILITKQHKVSEYNKDPLKIHVGSATVGGVTTGGVYTTGGGISQTDYRSEKVELIYRYIVQPKENEIQLSTITGEKEIKLIVLSNELAEKAKKSNIKEYINGHTIEVVESVKTSQGAAMLYMAGQTLAAASQLNREKSAGYPTQEKCQKIIDWLCGK